MGTSADRGRITDEEIERFRLRLDVPYGRPKPPHNLIAHEDTIRHFTWAYGDDNPLFSDPAYAAATRWGGLIAPPLYLLSHDGMRRMRQHNLMSALITAAIDAKASTNLPHIVA